jgi:uncharacterized membrane protein
MTDWIRAGPTVVAAFLASLVEFVEAFTIVLAVGTVRGWRSALTGVAAAIGLLIAIVVAGSSVLEQLPLSALRLSIGFLLLLFGMRWLRKSALRMAGVISLHDESAVFTSEALTLRAQRVTTRAALDPVAIFTAFNGVLIEGLEVVFIVVGAGAVGHALLPAALGAAAAGAVVVALGLVLRAPLTRIPENSLKLAVGVLLSAFGTFWIGEGLGFSWIGGDLSVIGLAAAFLGSVAFATAGARRVQSHGAPPGSTRGGA